MHDPGFGAGSPRSETLRITGNVLEDAFFSGEPAEHYTVKTTFRVSGTELVSTCACGTLRPCTPQNQVPTFSVVAGGIVLNHGNEVDTFVKK